MIISQILHKAVKVFTEENLCLTQNSYARDEIDTPVSSESREATCICMEGAVYRAAFKLNLNNHIYEAVRFADDYMKKHTKYIMITWNDSIGRTKEEVITMLQEIAEDAEIKGV